MTDLLLLFGTALCVLSVPLAVISLLRTQPPRAAAAALVFGLIAIFVAAWLAPEPFRVNELCAVWTRLLNGELRLVAPN